MHNFMALLILPMVINDVSSYAGQETRQIKALSEQEVASLARGEGMGFAKAAELNSFPGPKHVLELADELELTDTQRQQTQALFEAMRADAVDLGARIIDAEAALDEMFAARDVDSESLQVVVTTIAELRAALRFVHLDAHLRQTEILNKHQVMQYVALRGYDGSHDGDHEGHH